ncbi:MAG: exonuclease domain-containing protein [Candidatus Omnitrophota bacterium]
MKIARPLVILDLETTGTWIERDRIVEIGMIKCLTDGSKIEFVKRTNPGMPMPSAVTKITGINDKDLEGAPPFKAIAKEVLSFIGDSDLAGFGIERFDLPILERELVEAGLRFERRDRIVYDAQKIYHIHEKRTLTAAYQFYCQKELVNAHSALGDVEATLEILGAQVKKYGAIDTGVESLREIDYERSTQYFDKERKFRWWNGELYPVFGKFARKQSIRKIAQKEPSYLQWILSQDFSKTVKDMIRDALGGKYPKAQ